MHASILLGIRKTGFLSAGIFVVLLAVSLRAQTASPAADQPSQPFSWFNPTTGEIGVTGFENTTEITPAGYLRTGFEELMFFAGPDLQPTSANGQIHEEGGRPIVRYAFQRDGISYRFAIFTGKLDKSAIIQARQQAKFPFMPGFNIESGIIEPEIAFVRVDITNSDREPRRAVFASGVRYSDPDAPKAQAGHSHDGEAFNPGWTNNFDGANFYRFNRDLYSFPSGYADRSFTVRKNWSEPNPQDVFFVTRLSPAPTTPIGIVTYARELNPGEKWTLDFKMPVIPTADPFVISAIDDASLDGIEAQVHGEPDAPQ